LSRFFEQADHLRIFGLPEIAVMRAHRIERVGGREAHHLVALAPELGETFRRRDRDREHEPRRIMAREAAQSRLDRGAGRDPVIDDNRDPPLGRERRPIAQVILPPPLDLGELACLLGFDIARAWRDASHDILVQDELRILAIDHRAERQLLMPRRADLAHQQHIEGRGERLGDFKADRHAAARQRQHERPILPTGCQRSRELPPGIAAIAKERLKKRHPMRLLRRGELSGR
jgi:hypothetical protein